MDINFVIVVQLVAPPIVHTFPIFDNDWQPHDLVQVGIDLFGGVIVPLVTSLVHRASVQRLKGVSLIADEMTHTGEGLNDGSLQLHHGPLGDGPLDDGLLHGGLMDANDGPLYDWSTGHNNNDKDNKQQKDYHRTCRVTKARHRCYYENNLILTEPIKIPYQRVYNTARQAVGHNHNMDIFCTAIGQFGMTKTEVAGILDDLGLLSGYKKLLGHRFLKTHFRHIDSRFIAALHNARDTIQIYEKHYFLYDLRRIKSVKKQVNRLLARGRVTSAERARLTKGKQVLFKWKHAVNAANREIIDSEIQDLKDQRVKDCTEYVRELVATL